MKRAPCCDGAVPDPHPAAVRVPRVARRSQPLGGIAVRLLNVFNLQMNNDAPPPSTGGYDNSGD
jgi:hypothetical protein